jgi:hypothetical protein
VADLISLDEYKEYEGLISTKEDVKLELLIASTSQLVKTYCGNNIIDYYYEDKVEEFSVKWDTDLVQLTESPVVSVSSVEHRQDETSSYTTMTASDYYVDTNTDSIFRVRRNWPKGLGAVKVTYRAGYPSTPLDLKLAVIDLVRYYLKNEYKDRQTLSGASIENPASSSSSSVAFPDHIKRVLDLYKNI